VIDLRSVVDIARISDDEIHLSSRSRTHKLRGEGLTHSAASMQRWFDELVVRLDETRLLSSSGEPERHPSAVVALLEDDDEHIPWYHIPQSSSGRVLFFLTLPLKALMHMTCPEVARPGGAKYYPLTLLLATAWLALLAYVMTLTLDRIGCALAIPSTVIGLTLGAIGTSFPNLYASILTAQAGQAGMSICQAFGSNTFNLCIGLGLVWLLESLLGTCTYGSLGTTRGQSCHGCYMPEGFNLACPHLDRFRPPDASGSLAGTSVIVFVCIGVLLLTFVGQKCRISRLAAGTYFLLYLLYLLYEVGASYGDFAPICFGPGRCL